MSPRVKKRAAWVIAILLIANEIRGIIVVAIFLKTVF